MPSHADLLPPLLVSVHVPFLTEFVALFALIVLMAYVSHRLRLVPIIGFLLAGVLIGPYALGVVKDFSLINTMAEIGVILLLFTIGAEYSLERLARIKQFIFIGGGLQVGLTIAVVTGVLLLFGIGWKVGVFTACLIALSSTAIVLKLLAERDANDTPAGQITLGVLIFQDLAVIVMVLLIPMLGSSPGDGVSALDLGWALAKAGLIIAAVLVFARKVVPYFLERVARTRSHELFLLTIVALSLGTAWLTNLAGVSLALGAFMAGLIVSESSYREYAVGEILPLQTIFTAIFFVSVGMLLDVRSFLNHPVLVLGAAAGIFLLNTIITAGSVLVLGYPVRVAVTAGLAMSQIGEFSFVLATAGRPLGLTPAGLGEVGEQTFIAVTVLLMIATPFIMSAEPAINKLLQRMGLAERGRRRSQPEVSQAAAELRDHVIAVGYGPAGRRLVQVMQRSDIPFVVVELNPFSLAELTREGIPVLYGDASRRHILDLAGLERAKLLVVVINDRSATRRVVEVANLLSPTTEIIARVRFLSEVEEMMEAGADVVIPEEMETSVQLFAQVMKAYQVPPDEVQRLADAVRADGYQVFRNEVRAAHLMVLEGLDEEGMHTRAVAVRAGAPVAGKTLEELALRRDHGLTVLAVRRDGRTFTNPSGDFQLEPNDRLVLLGTGDQFARTNHLFRSRPIE